MAGVLFTLNHTSFLDCTAVQQKFLCNGCFTGVRVRNNRKCTPILYLLSQIGQSRFLQRVKIGILDLSSAFQSTHERDFIDVLQMSANRNTVCQTRDSNTERLE